MTHEDYVSFGQAKALKKLGFNWGAMKGYAHFPGEKVKSFNAQEENINSKYSKWHFAAPTLAQTQKWLREVKGIAINVIAHDGGYYHWEGVYLPSAPINYSTVLYKDRFSSYEEALSDGIDKAIEILKE